MLAIYDPVNYAKRSSGVVQDALAMGKPLIVSEKTKFGQEAIEKGVAIGCSDFTAESAAKAIINACECIEDLSDNAIKEAEKIHSTEPIYIQKIKQFIEARTAS